MVGADGRVLKDLPVTRELDCEAHRQNTRSNQAGRCHDALSIEHVKQLMPSLVEGAQQLAAVNSNVVKKHRACRLRMGTQLFDGVMRQALAVDVDEKHRNAVAPLDAIRAHTGTRDDEHRIRLGYAGDPDLPTRQQPTVAVRPRERRHRKRVCSRLWLGQGHGVSTFPRDHRRKVLRLLLVRAVQRHRYAAEDRIVHE